MNRLKIYFILNMTKGMIISFFNSEDYNTDRENSSINNFFDPDSSGIQISPIGTNLNNESSVR